MTLEETAKAETVEDAFAGLMEQLYQDRIKKGTPEWGEARKVFFCGAAFITSSFAKWSQDPEKEKQLEGVINEIRQFRDEVVVIHKLHKDIENAGRYETND